MDITFVTLAMWMIRPVLPASAGMILNQCSLDANRYSAPRIRGDDPYKSLEVYKPSLCSPHPRG